MPTPCYEQVLYGPSIDVTPEDVANVVIPLTGTHSLLSDVVYGDDEINPLYTEHTLTLEAIIYGNDNVEDEVARIRNILTTPSLQLDISPVGLGTISRVNVSQKDMKGGPFPQYVSVEPIASNNAILVKWSVIFRTTECSFSASEVLLQYNVEQDFEIDDDGNVQFTVNITYQTRDPILNPNTYKAITEILTAGASKSFQGMRKKTRVSLSRDQRVMSIRLNYKEIESDNAFFPFTSNIQVKDEVESTLLGSSVLGGKGFYTWKRNISGSIKLPARIHKLYAWNIFLKILRARFIKLYPGTKLSAIFDATPPPAQPNNDDATRETDYYYPLKLKISNPIYSRELQFETSYIVVTDIKNLIENSKIVARVNTAFVGAEEDSEPRTLSFQWNEWQQSRDHPLNGKFGYVMDGTPIVFNQCLSIHTDHTLTPDNLLPFEGDPDYDVPSFLSSEEGTSEERNEETALYPDGVKNPPAFNWISYENDFEIMEETNNIPVSHLEEPAAGYYSTTEAASVYAHRGYDSGMSLHGKTTKGIQDYPNEVIERGHSQFFVRMIGSAVRVEDKIPIPFVTSVAGQTAIRVKARASHKQISKGDLPVYAAKWDILYAVTGDIYSEDILNTIKTTGAPAHYT